MARVTDKEVKAIIRTNIEDISLFMQTAELIVTEQLVGKGLSDDRLSKIELYLSAHFVTLREQQLKSEKFGDSSESYQGETSTNLRASLYGQTAIILDTTRTLANLGNSMAEVELL